MYTEEYKKYLEKEQSKNLDKTLQDIQELIHAIYEITSIGGPLHIVLDDFNLEDRDIVFCQKESIPKEADIVVKTLCEKCAELLLKVPYEERVKNFGEQE